MGDLRETAFQVLYQVMEEGEYSHLALAKAFRTTEMIKRDRAFLTRLCEGTLERMITIDYILNSCSKTKVNKMKPIIRTVLRMSVYQIIYMDGVPDSAACNEAVKLVKKKGLVGLSGFVNGVLRSIVREKDKKADTAFYPNASAEPVRYLSVCYSMPEWICSYLMKEYGLQQAEKIVEGCLRNPDTTIRTNCSKISPEQLKERLMAQNITVEAGAYVPYAFHLSGYDSIEQLPEFSEGLFGVQDESSMLVALAANVKAGDSVLDVCAAPGGKTLHVADCLKVLGSGQITARDISESKVALIQENLAMMQFDNVQTEVWDAEKPDERMLQAADVVIADLPCSGLGIMAKKPEIRYRMTKEAQDNLAELQKKILSVVQAYVKPGGTLIYSTCTINRDENQNNADYVCETFGFQKEDLKAYVPEACKGFVGSDGYLQLLPGISECDGFFIARLRKGNE